MMAESHKLGVLESTLYRIIYMHNRLLQPAVYNHFCVVIIAIHKLAHVLVQYPQTRKLQVQTIEKVNIKSDSMQINWDHTRSFMENIRF